MIVTRKEKKGNIQKCKEEHNYYMYAFRTVQISLSMKNVKKPSMKQRINATMADDNTRINISNAENVAEKMTI